MQHLCTTRAHCYRLAVVRAALLCRDAIKSNLMQQFEMELIGEINKKESRIKRIA